MSSGRILVANIGTTSFKFRLFEMPSEKLLAKGAVDRIGAPESAWSLSIGDTPTESGKGSFPDYAAAVEFAGKNLSSKGLGDFSTLSAFGFKPVFAKDISGTQELDEKVLGAMEAMTTLFPAHNPPYVNAVRVFHKLYPDIPCIGTFETAFYDHLGPEYYRLPVPIEWESKYGIRRFGFHGASHRFVTERAAQLRKSDHLRIISCHLGGSSSITGVKNGKAVDSSWSMTAQSGIPHNNRYGDFDSSALVWLAKDLGLGIEAVDKALSSQAGLKGMSGLSNGDIRDLKEAAAKGNENARLALHVFVREIRKFIGQMLVSLDGADVLIFTGGIGEYNPDIRSAVCKNMDFAGLKLDESINASVMGKETVISAPDSRVEVRVIPTNEEIVIARNAWAKLKTLQPA